MTTALDLWLLAQQQQQQQAAYTGAYQTYGANQGNNTYANPTGTAGGEGGGTSSATTNWGAMPATGYTGPAAYGLENLTSGQMFGSGDDAEMQGLLSRVQQYDPNAKFVPTQVTDGQGNTTTQYQLVFDQSKLPKQTTPGNVNAGGNASGLLNTSNGALTNDPNYGITTAPTNYAPQKTTALDIYGPLIVGLLGGAASAGLLGGGATDAAASATDAGGVATAGQADADATTGLLTDPTIAANTPLGSAESSLYGPTASVDPIGAYNGTGLLNNTPLGSAESSLYGPDVGANPGAALGSPGDNAPLGSAESSLYGSDAQTNPAAALGGPAAATTGLSLGSVLSKIPGILSALGKIPGLTGAGTGTGSGAGGGGGSHFSPGQLGDAGALIRAFYGNGLNPNEPMMQVQNNPYLGLLR